MIVITVARKPLEGSVATNVQRWGTGALNIDACRVGSEPITVNRWDDGSKPFGGGAGHSYHPETFTGRWPANLILSHAPGCGVDCEGDCPVPEMSHQGALVGAHSAGSQRAPQYGLSQHPDWLFNGFGANARVGDTGSVARFFKQVSDSHANVRI